MKRFGETLFLVLDFTGYVTPFTRTFGDNVNSTAESEMKPGDLEFDKSVARFKRFLQQNGYLENIIWLLPDDLLLSGKRLFYIRVPVPTDNETKTHETYNSGVTHGRGLLMYALCEMKGSTCCFVWYPRRQEDVPQSVWPHDGSVKLSVMTVKIAAKPVRNRLLWALLKLRYRGKQNLKDFLLCG